MIEIVEDEEEVEEPILKTSIKEENGEEDVKIEVETVKEEESETDNLADKAKEEYIKSIPLGDYGTTEDVASLVLFLLSKSSKYITGEVITLLGGSTRAA